MKIELLLAWAELQPPLDVKEKIPPPSLSEVAGRILLNVIWLQKTEGKLAGGRGNKGLGVIIVISALRNQGRTGGLWV